MEAHSAKAAEHRPELDDLLVGPDAEPAFDDLVSLGVAAFPEHGANALDLMRAADRALYRAKESGRDCVVVAEGVAGANQESP